MSERERAKARTPYVEERNESATLGEALEKVKRIRQWSDPLQR